MSEATTFTPKLGEIETPRPPRKSNGVVNAPPVGTPMRATLGGTVIEGIFAGGQHQHPLLDILIPSNSYISSTYSCWIEQGWHFEVLDLPLAEAYPHLTSHFLEVWERDVASLKQSRG